MSLFSIRILRSIEFGKALTTYGDLVEAVIHGLEQARGDVASIDILKHGTTQIINTLLERSGASVALVTTAGFRDLLEIGRAGRPLPFDLKYQRSSALVPRDLRLEVQERIGGDGAVIEPLDIAQLAKIAAVVRERNIGALAVSFLNSFLNPAHEREAVQYLRQILPDCYVTCGTDLSREWYEYERTSTAVANAYVGPSAENYVKRSSNNGLPKVISPGAFWLWRRMAVSLRLNAPGVNLYRSSNPAPLEGASAPKHLHVNSTSGR